MKLTEQIDCNSKFQHVSGYTRVKTRPIIA